MFLSIHPFLGCLYSLPNSAELMKSEFLIFKDTEKCPYVSPLDEYKCFDEIDSGRAYPLVPTEDSRKGKCNTDSIIFKVMAQLSTKLEIFFWIIHVHSWNIQADIEDKANSLEKIWASLALLLRLNLLMLTRRGASKMLRNLVRKIQDMFQFTTEIFMHM